MVRLSRRCMFLCSSSRMPRSIHMFAPNSFRSPLCLLSPPSRIVRDRRVGIPLYFRSWPVLVYHVGLGLGRCTQSRPDDVRPTSGGRMQARRIGKRRAPLKSYYKRSPTLLKQPTIYHLSRNRNWTKRFVARKRPAQYPHTRRLHDNTSMRKRFAPCSMHQVREFVWFSGGVLGGILAYFRCVEWWRPL